jgi:hypothetical protein
VIELPARVHLSGCDYFLLALDRRDESVGSAANVCSIVLHLADRLDPDALREAIARSPLIGWLAGVRYVPRMPFFLRPIWVAGQPQDGLRPILREGQSPHEGVDLPCCSDPHRVTRPESAPGLAFDLIHRPEAGSTLCMTWHHTLMDARGAELLLGHLGSDGAADSLLEQMVPPRKPERAIDWLAKVGAFPGRLRDCRKSARHVAAMTGATVAHLAPAGGDGKEAGRRFHLISFDSAETARIDERARSFHADFRKSLIYLAAAMRATHAIRRERGEQGGVYIVAAPCDMRRGGARGPAFSNQLSFLFYRADADRLGDLGGLIRVLAGQMTEQLREETHRALAAMMAQFRRIPLGLYSRLVRGPTKGRIASFFFSDTGEVCPLLDRFLGLTPTDVIHLPPAICPPGLTVASSRYRRRLRLVLSWTGGRLSTAEAKAFERHVRRDLLGSER